jgi:CRP/FNR family transcriptional regulator
MGGRFNRLSFFADLLLPRVLFFTIVAMEPKLHVLKALPFLQNPGLKSEIFENSSIINAAAGEVIVRVGQYLKLLPLVITGSLRVFQQSDDREVLLYYVQPGETCIMSLTSCFFNTQSPTQAIADTETEILCVPAKFIQQWQRKYDDWNEFVIRTFQGRYNELLTSFNSVVFNNIESRVAEYLSNYSAKQKSNIVPVTHLALANELGTTRVVISRILKNFEHEGKVELHRSSIKIIKL